MDRLTANQDEIEIIYLDVEDNQAVKPEAVAVNDDVNKEEQKAPKNKGKRERSIARELFNYFVVIVFAFLFAVALNKLVIFNAVVPTPSMTDTISEGDRIIGFRLSYMFSEPQRGDIVIFHFPDDENEIYIKRIIGLPGDTVHIVNGELYINGNSYKEDYLYEPMSKNNYGPYQVPEDSYFVMGDNRNASDDSRFWNNKFVTRDNIIAKAIFRYYPSFGKVK